MQIFQKISIKKVENANRIGIMWKIIAKIVLSWLNHWKKVKSGNGVYWNEYDEMIKRWEKQSTEQHTMIVIVNSYTIII